jgi:transposase
VLRGKDVQEIEELKRQGPSIQAISRLMGLNRKTLRKYLRTLERPPAYGPRAKWQSKLDAHKSNTSAGTSTLGRPELQCP